MPFAQHPRILIVRLSAIGDVLHGLPVLCALRDALPKAMLGWVVEGRTAELLRGHKALDELIQVPRGWLNNERVLPTATHVIDRNLELLRPLVHGTPLVRFDLPQHAAEAATAQR